MTNCCICNDSIGRFVKGAPLSPEEPDLLMCPLCTERWGALSNPNDTYSYGIAKRYFEGHLQGACTSPKAKAAIEQNLNSAALKAKIKEEQASRAKEALEAMQSGDFLMTTTDAFAGYEILAYHGVHSSDCIMGTGIFADLDIAITDLTGEESYGSVDKVAKARERALERMVIKCAAAGGNAVVGIRYDTYNAATNAFCVGVTGTSVTVKKLD